MGLLYRSDKRILYINDGQGGVTKIESMTLGAEVMQGRGHIGHIAKMNHFLLNLVMLLKMMLKK